MKLRSVEMLATVLLATSGCVAASLQSIRSAGDLVAESRMLGRWHGVPPPKGAPLFDEAHWEPGRDWVVESRPNGQFRATVHDVEGTIVYAGAVVRLGDRLFLDLWPDSSEAEACRVFPLLPCHVFASLTFDRDTMVVGYLRSDWVTNAVREGRVSPSVGLAHTEDDEALLTGGPEEVRDMLAVAARSPGAFSIGKLVPAR
jgi:hypothetical protein